MNKKFSIIKQIDIEKIFKEIDNYRNQSGYDYLPHLFMNKDTMDAIERGIQAKDVWIYDASSFSSCCGNGVCAKLTGYKVFIDNDLDFGIVEIR